MDNPEEEGYTESEATPVTEEAPGGETECVQEAAD